jgi:hypothetical protein
MLAVSTELEPLAGAFKVARPTVSDTVRLGGIALACEFPEPRLLDWRGRDRQTRLRGGEALDGDGRVGGRGAGDAYFSASTIWTFREARSTLTNCLVSEARSEVVSAPRASDPTIQFIGRNYQVIGRNYQAGAATSPIFPV